MKLLPVMVIIAPATPFVGEKPLMPGVMKKFVLVVLVPTGVMTVTGPVEASAGTLALICVVEVTLALAVTPLNCTTVAPLMKFCPLMVTCVPGPPVAGVKLEMLGGEPTVKLVLVVFVPVVVLIVMGPVVALAGTTASSCTPMPVTLNDALMPLNCTLVILLKFWPLMVTCVPTGPPVGVKSLMDGAAPTTKFALVVAKPFVVETTIGPVVAPVGTKA